MIVMMKAISVIFDIENGVTEVPTNLLEFSSYVFHPASVIFGPFLTYKNYTQIFQAHSFVSFVLVDTPCSLSSRVEVRSRQYKV